MNIQPTVTPIITIEDTFHLGTKAIIYNTDGRVLALKFHKGTKQYWDLPGGRVQIGETSEQTVLREVQEETGISHLHNIRHVGMLTSRIRIQVDSQQNVGLIISFYTATTPDNHITLSAEHQEYVWITPQEIIQLLEPVYGSTFTSYVTVSRIERNA